jgi:hypothetical protein
MLCYTEYGAVLDIAIIILKPQNYHDIVLSSNLINSLANLTGFRRKGENNISHPESLPQSRFPRGHLETEVLARFWSSHDIDFVWWRNSGKVVLEW